MSDLLSVEKSFYSSALLKCSLISWALYCSVSTVINTGLKCHNVHSVVLLAVKHFNNVLLKMLFNCTIALKFIQSSILAGCSNHPRVRWCRGLTFFPAPKLRVVTDPKRDVMLLQLENAAAGKEVMCQLMMDEMPGEFFVWVSHYDNNEF